ncbi:MAG: nucleotide sugar dehydrogenase [Bacteroidota bacterium]
MKKIGVFGLGYVGIVNLSCFAHLGNQVTGVDIKPHKVDAVLKGKSPISEPKVEKMLQSGLASGHIHATVDPKSVILESDILLICVGTPSQANGKVNLDYTINTTMEIGKILKEAPHSMTIAYRSTIPPGTVEKTLRPVLENQLGEDMQQIKLAFFPEFLREGSAVDDFLNAPRIVLGTQEEEINELVELVSYNEASPVIVTDTETAEFVKYVDNSFHALKIAFANEIYQLGHGLGVDVSKANEIFLADKVLNISPAYLRPGLPFGGSCLPKDLRAIRQLSEENEIALPMVNQILESNKDFQQRILDKVTAFGVKKILMVGLTFKNHTDDVRESPMLRLAQDLIDWGADLSIYDADINAHTLRIEQAAIVKYIDWDLPRMVHDSQLIIVSKRFMPEVIKYTHSDHMILNLSNNKSYDTSAKVHYLYRDEAQDVNVWK